MTGFERKRRRIETDDPRPQAFQAVWELCAVGWREYAGSLLLGEEPGGRLEAGSKPPKSFLTN